MTPVSSEYDANVVIAKYDSSFNLQWHKVIGDGGRTRLQGMCIDQEENIFLSGELSGTADFDPGYKRYNLTAKGIDGYFMKLNNRGDFEWAHHFGGEYDHEGISQITLDAQGNIYISAIIGNLVDFDLGEGEAKHYAFREDAFIVKYDSSLNLQWVAPLHADDEVNVDKLTVEEDRIIISGSFRKKIIFNRGPNAVEHVSEGQEDGYIAVYSLDGQYLFNRIFKASKSVVLIHPEKYDNYYYVTGHFTEDVDVDPGSGKTSFTSKSPGEVDIFFLVLDSNLDFKSANHYGGLDRDFASPYVDAINKKVHLRVTYSDGISFGNFGTFNAEPNTLQGAILSFDLCQKPKFLTSPLGGYFQTGDQVKLITETEGQVSDYLWFKDNKRLINSSRVTGVDRKRLVVNDIDTADAGTYSCRIVNPCGDTIWSDSANVRVESTNNTAPKTSSRISIYPNPASSSISIHGLNGQAMLKISTLHGKQVFNTKLEFDGPVVLPTLPSGNYLITLIDDNWVFTKRITIEQSPIY